MGIPDHLTCLLRNLYAGQEATVKIRHGIANWFQIRKGVHKGYILSPYLFKLYAEYIMWNARLDAAQTRIKIPGRNINTFVYADDTTLMAESKELKSFLIKMKEESENFGLKLHVQKTKIMASGPITSWQIEGETMETVTDFIWGAPKSRVRSLGREDPLEKEMVTHSSILAWKIPWMEKPGRLQSIGL